MKLMQGKFYLQSMQQDVRLYSRKGSLMQGVIMERIRSVEEQVRNIAAHEIVSVTDDWLYRKVQLHAQDIIRLLEKLVLRAGIRVQSKDWKSYDQMNQDIIRALLEGSPEKSEYVGG